MKKYLAILAIAGATSYAHAQQVQFSTRSAEYTAEAARQTQINQYYEMQSELQELRFRQVLAEADAFVNQYQADRARRLGR
jgi:hypothetical protein